MLTRRLSPVCMVMSHQVQSLIMFCGCVVGNHEQNIFNAGVLFLLLVIPTVDDWPIVRSYEEAENHVGKSDCDEQKGYGALPLLKLPFSKIIPDTLHLFHRVTGKLLAQAMFFVGIVCTKSCCNLSFLCCSLCTVWCFFFKCSCNLCAN